MIRRLLYLVLFASLAAGQARAGSFSLDYNVAGGGTIVIDGNVVPVSAFTIDAIFFTDNLINEATGEALYLATSITALIDNISFNFDQFASDYGILLADGTNETDPGFFTAALLFEGQEGFLPAYTGATTPGWSATNPTSTGFSGYTNLSGTTQSYLPLINGTDEVILTFDPNIGLTTTLTAVPEPSSIVLAGMAALAGLGVWARRRRAKVAGWS